MFYPRKSNISMKCEDGTSEGKGILFPEGMYVSTGAKCYVTEKQNMPFLNPLAFSESYLLHGFLTLSL